MIEVEPNRVSLEVMSFDWHNYPDRPIEDFNLGVMESSSAAHLIPELSPYILGAKWRAEDLMQSRYQTVKSGEGDFVPEMVDSLGTANLVISAEDDFGVESPEARLKLDALVLDCHRLLLECYRENTWEYFPKSAHVYNAQDGDFYSNNISIAELTDNGLAPASEPEERARLINDSIEQRGVAYGLGKMILARSGVERAVIEPVTTASIQECADWAIRNYELDNDSEITGGYAPKIKKMMIRCNTFDPETNSRHQEQIGVSGVYIDHDVVVDALRIMDERLPQDMSKVDTHSVHIVTKGDDIDAWSYVQLLDELASKKHNKTIFMGEVLADDKNPDYQKAKDEAATRSDLMDSKAEDLAQQVLVFAKSNMDTDIANKLVRHSVRQMMLDDCAENPDLAKDMFNQKTVDGFKLSKEIKQSGDFMLANRIRLDTENQAPAAGGCGAGSCGLVAVDLTRDSSTKTNSKSMLKTEKDLRDKVGFKQGDKVLRDVARPCSSCGEKGGVVYSFNSSKVNKYCENCEEFESTKTANVKESPQKAASSISSVDGLDSLANTGGILPELNWAQAA